MPAVGQGFDDVLDKAPVEAKNRGGIHLFLQTCFDPAQFRCTDKQQHTSLYPAACMMFLFACIVGSFFLNAGNYHFEIHVIDIRYWIFQPPSRERLETNHPVGGGSVKVGVNRSHQMKPHSPIFVTHDDPIDIDGNPVREKDGAVDPPLLDDFFVIDKSHAPFGYIDDIEFLKTDPDGRSMTPEDSFLRVCALFSIPSIVFSHFSKPLLNSG